MSLLLPEPGTLIGNQSADTLWLHLPHLFAGGVRAFPGPSVIRRGFRATRWRLREADSQSGREKSIPSGRYTSPNLLRSVTFSCSRLGPASFSSFFGADPA